ncbi:phosphate ABC transporter substrate-binding/OmpA family protein [Parasulfitobacter algicola]|uniref:Substrate-binding domain-containing protein n=1 Tax=Parasulfitobacter algicola TaxID=2614809 RepID=A0ABX2IUY7_9RHOB|nr:phosphate ABC transporter substrate-binding/OmpA family protein [Sulfitobacter algicola]NSX56731.1 substrate-binding domain-containing protein [Sulfitobacter algicola]
MKYSVKTAFYPDLFSATVISLAIAGTAAYAESVVLTSPDGEINLSGDLVEFTGSEYIIKTSVGQMKVSAAQVSCSGPGCPAPTFQVGSNVSLQSLDGTIDIKGTLVDFADENYTVKTSLGNIKMSSDVVRCVGAGCPQVGGISIIPTSTPVPTAASVNPASADLRIAGSDTLGLGLLPYLTEGYASYLRTQLSPQQVSDTVTLASYVSASGRPVATHYINATGSGDAFDALLDRSAELGMASRPAKVKEAAALFAAGAGDMYGPDNHTVVAVDSLAVIVHPDNPISSLSTRDISSIYQGFITNWSQVGGRNAPITVISREDGSSTRGVFENAIFSGQERPLGSRTVYPEGDNPEMAAAVQNDVNAIAYVGFAYSQGLKRLDLTSSCGITSTASTFAVKTEEYPLNRRLYFYYRPDNMTTEARKFLEYVSSPAADEPIAQSSFVNFAVERTSQLVNNEKISNLLNSVENPSEITLARNLMTDMQSWDRLSTTIRFPTGSSSLGKKEINDLNRLISYLETRPANTRVAVVGFTDDVGSFTQNLSLSNRRAQSVAQSIARLAGNRLRNIEFQTKGYGELSPSVCNTDTIGQSINRRVEVWIQERT